MKRIGNSYCCLSSAVADVYCVQRLLFGVECSRKLASAANGLVRPVCSPPFQYRVVASQTSSGPVFGSLSTSLLFIFWRLRMQIHNHSTENKSTADRVSLPDDSTLLGA